MILSINLHIETILHDSVKENRGGILILVNNLTGIIIISVIKDFWNSEVLGQVSAVGLRGHSWEEKCSVMPWNFSSYPKVPLK